MVLNVFGENILRFGEIKGQFDEITIQFGGIATKLGEITISLYYWLQFSKFPLCIYQAYE